ncbi:MAG TPA: hypothetical protein VGF86_06115 [Candidatus Tumulicola sp.]|jgi:hypothetical protein
MKLLRFALAIVALLPGPAAAQLAPTNGFTDADVARFRKLDATLGHWVCQDRPTNSTPDSTSDTIVTTREGNFYVSREVNAEPHTTYTRWSHALQRYIATTLYDAGGTFIFTTTADDPNNATWSVAFPTPGMMPATQMPQGYTIRTAGNTITETEQYYDAMQTLKTGSAICTRSS